MGHQNRSSVVRQMGPVMVLVTMAMFTAPLGERTNTPPIKQARVAAKAAALLGEDYHGAFPHTAPSVIELLSPAHPRAHDSNSK